MAETWTIVNVGLIGCGEIAQVVHIPTLNFMKAWFRIAYLCDVSAAALAHCAAKIPGDDAVKTTRDPAELCASPDVDAVIVASSDEYHALHAILALKHDKHVLVEKPMALNRKAVDAIIEAEKTSKGSLMVGYMRRYAAPFEDAVKEIGGLDKVLYARVRDIIGPNSFFVDQSGTFPAKFTDFRPEDSEDKTRRADEMVAIALKEDCGGIPVTPETTLMWRIFGGLGSHDLSVMREALGIPTSVVGSSLGFPFWNVLYRYPTFTVSYESGIDNIPRFDAHLEIYGADKTIRVQYDTPYVKGLAVTMHVCENDNGAYKETMIRKSYEDPYTLEMKTFWKMAVEGERPKTTAEDAGHYDTMGSEPIPSVRWGIVGLGTISSWFVHDLVLDRPDAQVRHVVQALGTSSTSKGESFISTHCGSQTPPTVYNSYDGVYNDANVDIVYIGTPHVLHYRNALDAIAAGKHVLCEKPIAMNSQQVEKLQAAAKAKGVFLMEAVWTRFFPIIKQLQSLLHEDKIIGDVSHVQVDFGLYMPISEAKPNARVASKELGAGALLDIGIYTLTWASLILDSSPKRSAKVKPKLVSSMLFHDDNAEGRIDEVDTIVLNYPDVKAQAVCTASLLRKTRDEFCWIEGTKGFIAVGGVAASKPGYLVIRVNDEEEKKLEFDVPGMGFHYEADAVAQDVLAGRLENQTCPLKATLNIMSQMDEARAQSDLYYPKDVEAI
ncbi:hypothetical protein DV735_g2560, partial [Chaetothyriales sp. CBS 134920]